VITLRSLPYAFLILLAGCSHPAPKATVIVLDTSLSITPRAEKAALDAIQVQILHLGRGDTLILIPITGDAQNDAGGRILRLHAPTIREPYDADLRRFRADAQKQFAAWIVTVHAESSRTDILGALDAARQELASLPKENNRRLIVVSDFLEDDGAYRFTTDGSLRNPARAREFAARLHAQRGLALPSAFPCLGRLESSDFAPLSAERKEAVQAFWKAYLAGNGREPEIQVDGIGLLTGTDAACSGERR